MQRRKVLSVERKSGGVMNDESGESMELMGGVLVARVRIAAAAPLRITLSMSTESMHKYVTSNSAAADKYPTRALHPLSVASLPSLPSTLPSLSYPFLPHFHASLPLHVLPFLSLHTHNPFPPCPPLITARESGGAL